MKTSSLLLALLVAASAGDAAVIVKSVAPGEIFEHSPTEGYVNNIDINGDGVTDFFTSTYGAQSSIVPTGNNRIMAFDELPPDLGWTLAAMIGGEAIGTDPEFGGWRGQMDRVGPLDNGGAVIYKCSGRGPIGEPPTCFSTITAQQLWYVGVEFENEGERHYGWVSLWADGLVDIHLIQVRGWAWETEAGRHIAAGAIPEPAVGGFIVVATSCAVFRRRRSHRMPASLIFTPYQNDARP